MNDHLIFFDRDCGFCYKAIYYLTELDEESHLFLFAPLNGETAKEMLTGPNRVYANADSLVLVEDYESDQRRFWIRSQAVFRIYWLHGSKWIGWMCYLPPWMCDWAYKYFAKHRHRLGFGWQRKEFQTDRFLP